MRTSVAVATYQGERHLPDLLRSIAAQTVGVDEVVLSDDGSSDSTVALTLETAAQIGLPVRMLPPAPRRLGPAANFSRAAAAALGEVVFLADQDDIWEPDKVRASLLALEHTSAVFHDASLIDGYGRALAGSLWERAGFSSAEQVRARDGDLMGVLLRHPVVSGATLAIRRPALAAALPFPVGPHDQWLALFLAARGELVSLDSPLLRYRLHDDNNTGLAAVSALGRFHGLRSTRARLGAESAQLQECRARLSHAGGGTAPEVLADLESKAAFLLRRTRRSPLPSRVVRVSRDVAAGTYRRWSEGNLRSAALDLLPQPRGRT